MKRFIFLSAFVLLIFSCSYCQSNGALEIFNTGQFGLLKFQSFKRINNGTKDIYAQIGVNFNINPNESGRYFKLNKINTSWYIPANGFINSAWGIDYQYGFWDCQPVSFFTISPRDTNLLLKFQISPAASCPDARTLYTTNGGYNFSFAPFGCGGTLIFPNGGDYNPNKDSILIFGYSNFYYVGIFISRNGGVNWYNIDSLQGLRQTESYNPNYNGYGFLKYNPFDTSFVYANGLNNVILSTNGGYDFTSTTVKWLKNIIFSYKDSVIYGYNDNKLYYSHNKGLTWDSVQTNVKFTSLEINPDFPNILYGGDSLGVHRSTNYGLNWFLYNNTFTPSKLIIGISKDAASGDTFYVATNKSVYKVWASYIVKTENQNTVLPLKFSLEQNYPNPFNPTTSIKYQVESIKHIKLVVYDILGKEVAVLVNEKQSPGEYETQFPNNSITSNQLPSGVYFYTLFADGERVDTKKMVLLK